AQCAHVCEEPRPQRRVVCQLGCDESPGRAPGAAVVRPALLRGADDGAGRRRTPALSEPPYAPWCAAGRIRGDLSTSRSGVSGVPRHAGALVDGALLPLSRASARTAGIWRHPACPLATATR